MEDQPIILVGYDGSNAAKAALNLGVKHAEAFKGKVVLIRSLISGTEKDNDEIQAAKQDLAYAEKYCNENAVPCETHLLIRGLSPGEDIIQFAEDCHASEIIMGVRRRSQVGKILFGSVARYVILQAACPVVTVK